MRLSNAWVIILALILVLAALAAYYALSGHSAPPSPPGTGASTTRIAAQTPCSSSSGEGICLPSTGVYLVILGTEGCPHCRAMKEYLPTIYTDVFFCEIARQGSNCAKAFMKLFTAGVTKGVPTIVACNNITHSVVFVEVGEYKNTTWWRTVLEHPPSRPVVYEGGKQVSDLDPVTASEVGKLLCNGPPSDATKLEGS